MFDRLEDTLVVERSFKTTWFVLVSGILGSIAGLLGIMGSLMQVSENMIGGVNSKIVREIWLQQIKDKRDLIFNDQMIEDGINTNTRDLNVD